MEGGSEAGDAPSSDTSVDGRGGSDAGDDASNDGSVDGKVDTAVGGDARDATSDVADARTGKEAGSEP
jgi:hypothetical protein